MHRRNFLVQSGLVTLGTLILPIFLPGAGYLSAADGSPQSSAQVTPTDRALLHLLAAYGSDVYFWGSQVFARATGTNAATATTNLLVRVDDSTKLVAFLRSKPFKSLGVVRSAGSTLSFTFDGVPYTVTNETSADFNRAVAGGGVTRGRPLSGEPSALFAHQTLLYHPATDTLSDPQFALQNHRLELAETPTGSLKARFQTLLQGWLESRQQGLKLGKNFRNFQDDLLGSQPTDKAAHKVVAALLENISSLAAAFSIDDLRPLLLSPLVSESLQAELGLDGEQVLTQLETLRTELSAGDYSDAALWLATLLGTQLKDGTAGEWLDVATGNDATNAATRAALSGACKLLQAPASGTR